MGDLKIRKNFARAFARALANEIWGAPGLDPTIPNFKHQRGRSYAYGIQAPPPLACCNKFLAPNHKTIIVADVYRGRISTHRLEQCSAGGLRTWIMKIGIHAPSKPAVVISLLLAILALGGILLTALSRFLSRCLHTSLEHSASWWKSESEADFVVAGP